MKSLFITKIYLIILLLGAGLVHASSLSKVKLPEIDIMPGMKTEWVAKKMIYNDHPMSIQNFSSINNAESVMQYYASKWKLKGHGQLSHQRVGHELTIGMQHNGFIYSVQVKNTSTGSLGSMVVTADKKYGQGNLSFPLAPGAIVKTRIHSEDMGIRAETITATSYRSALDNSQWYQSEMRRNGWKVQTNMMGESLDAKQEYQRGKQQCQITFTKKSPQNNYRSLIIIHWIKG